MCMLDYLIKIKKIQFNENYQFNKLIIAFIN